SSETSGPPRCANTLGSLLRSATPSSVRRPRAVNGVTRETLEQVPSRPMLGAASSSPDDALPPRRRMPVKPPDEDDIGLTVWKAIIVGLMLIGGCSLVMAGMMWLTQP